MYKDCASSDEMNKRLFSHYSVFRKTSNSALVRESSMWLSNSLLGELRWDGAIPELYDLREACGL